MSSRNLIALAGQPNIGKSTIFNMLTGTRQFVANYPGITVEKKSGYFSHQGQKMELVDLPGTYSMTSYSLEERVTRNFLLHEKPALTINVLDGANLKRNLYFTFQLLEMGLPMLVVLNMMDVVKNKGMEIDLDELSRRLSVPVVGAVGSRGKGKNEILTAINQTSEKATEFRIDYGPMEPTLDELEKDLAASEKLTACCSPRWLAVKLMEEDSEAQALVRQLHPLTEVILSKAEQHREQFEDREDETPEGFIALKRHQRATEIVEAAVSKKDNARVSVPLTDRIDKIACHRFFGPLLLLGVIYVLYELAIVQGYNITNYTWPLLAKFRQLVDNLLPPATGFIDQSHIRGLGLWLVDSVNGLLNYIPIFFILFALIAMLEDIGYMPRMAFILDRLFRHFGLHGQSTLPLILSGVIVGGCAVPGIMACKGIADEKSRFATILIAPLMNCLAKTPFYILLIGIYFPEHKTIAFLFISTITIFIALPFAKILTLTVLKKKESAPFVMEMPRYHLPTIGGVLRRACERVWLFIKKVTTIVAAVAIVVYMLLQFPGLNAEQKIHFQGKVDQALTKFQTQVEKQGFAEQLPPDQYIPLLRYSKEYKKSVMMAGYNKDKRKAIRREFKERNAFFYGFLRPKGEKKAAKRKINRGIRKLLVAQKRIQREIKQEKITNSFLGRTGRAMEPFTRWAGFNWRINVALLSCLAAKESAVATLGALYEPDEVSTTANSSLEKRMATTESGMTPLHALAIMLFMALYPPCLAAMIMIKLQTNSWGWMLFSLIVPIILGVIVATAVFSGGQTLGLNGWQVMAIFYAIAVIITLLTALIKDQEIPDYVQ